VTGAAGFIGRSIEALLTGRGDEVVRVDALIPEAHGSSASAGSGPTCSTESTWSVTRRPWSVQA
jgi:nucleoside-diphosphate-sugar epimerase